MSPVVISFNGAIFVEVIGLIVNGVSAWILGDDHNHSHAHQEDKSRSHHHHSHHDHNRQAAYFHVLADALTSLLAIIALLAGKYAGWNWMDPVMGIVGAILITRWSWGLLRTTASVLLDEQQASIMQDIKRTVECDDTRVSDLHVWSIGPNLYAAIVAIVARYPQSPGHYRDRIQTGHSSLVHVTVEVETCPSHS